MSDHLIIRLRRAFDETGNSLLSDAIEELAHRSAINAELVAALEDYASEYCEGWCEENGGAFSDCGGCKAHAAIARAKP